MERSLTLSVELIELFIWLVSSALVLVLVSALVLAMAILEAKDTFLFTKKEKQNNKNWNNKIKISNRKEHLEIFISYLLTILSNFNINITIS